MLIKFLDCWPIDTAGPITGPVNACKPSNGVGYSIPSLAHAVNYIWTLPAGFTLTSGAGTPSITVDIYKWMAPHIDIVAPDNYPDDSRGYEYNAAN